MAEQQQIYKSEIERIWKAQFDSLSRKDEPQLTRADEERHKQGRIICSIIRCVLPNSAYQQPLRWGLLGKPHLCSVEAPRWNTIGKEVLVPMAAAKFYELKDW